VLTVVTVQLMMPDAVAAAVSTAVHDLGVRVIVRHRGAPAAGRPVAGARVTGVARPASSAGVTERQGVVRPR